MFDHGMESGPDALNAACGPATPEQRLTEAQRSVDEAFGRVNADPLYVTRAQLEEAVLDHTSYYDADRAAELGELFFSLLDHVALGGLGNANESSFCNPMSPRQAGSEARLPHMDVFLRDLMPTVWAVAGAWPSASLRNVPDPFFLSLTGPQRKAVFDSLQLLAELFPELSEFSRFADVRDFWTGLSADPVNLPAETEFLRLEKEEILRQASRCRTKA